MRKLHEQKCFGGSLTRWEHDSAMTGTPVRFQTYIPAGSAANASPPPVLLCLPGRAPEDFLCPSAAARPASLANMALVFPSPLGAERGKQRVATLEAQLERLRNEMAASKRGQQAWAPVCGGRPGAPPAEGRPLRPQAGSSEAKASFRALVSHSEAVHAPPPLNLCPAKLQHCHGHISPTPPPPTRPQIADDDLFSLKLTETVVTHFGACGVCACVRSPALCHPPSGRPRRLQMPHRAQRARSGERVREEALRLDHHGLRHGQQAGRHTASGHPKVAAEGLAGSSAGAQPGRRRAHMSSARAPVRCRATRP